MNENKHFKYTDIHQKLCYTSFFESYSIRVICERSLQITEKYLIEGIFFFLYIYNFATMIQEKLYKTIKDDCKEKKLFRWIDIAVFAIPQHVHHFEWLYGEMFTRHEALNAVYVMVIWRTNIDWVSLPIGNLLKKSRSMSFLQLLRD